MSGVHIEYSGDTESFTEVGILELHFDKGRPLQVLKAAGTEAWQYGPPGLQDSMGSGGDGEGHSWGGTQRCDFYTWKFGKGVAFSRGLTQSVSHCRECSGCWVCQVE